MNAIQLEFNLADESPEALRFNQMQAQIDQMSDSLGKARRRLFAELGELKKLYASIAAENHELKSALNEFKCQKTEWVYGQNGSLFEAVG